MPYQTDRLDGGWVGQGTGPAYGGAGVEPFPHREVYADAILGLPSATVRAHSVIQADRCFVGIGSRLYRSGPVGDAAWAGLTQVLALAGGATLTDLAAYKDDVMLLCGPSVAMKKHNPQSGALADPWVAGVPGIVGVGYKGELVWHLGQVDNRYLVHLSARHAGGGGTQFHVRNVDAPVVRIATFGGKAAIATRQSLFLFGGDWAGGAGSPGVAGYVPTSWSGEVEPIFTHGAYASGSDFVFLLPLFGRLYTWVGGRVAAYDPADAGWDTSGPEGRACHGAAVAAGWLVVALEARDGGSELWATNGAGWWRVRREEPGSGVTLVWPTATGGAGNRDLLVFRSGSATYELYRLVPRADLPTYADAAEWRSSLLDAGDRAAVKGWQRVGAAFAAPEGRGNPASADQTTVSLDWSLDAGATWINAATRSGGYGRSFTLEAALPSGTAARFLQLRVRWASVADWAPVLTGVWADWLRLDLPPARRRWELKVRVRDGQVRRDGGVDPRAGRAQAAALWAAWATGAPVPFRDVDFDADPVERSVRVVAIAQEEGKPGAAGRWGDGEVRLKLVEA